MVRKIDNDPHAGPLHENLELFKIGKKCFQSINWQKDKVRGKSEGIRRNIERIQKKKHALNVKRRRLAKEEETKQHTCQQMHHKKNKLEEHYNAAERAR